MRKVSIIIPCYNQENYIEESITSALNQTYPNTEIVCVNDGSTDNSGEIIKKFAEKYKNIVFFDETENKGLVFARNLAIEAAQGEYILPLDADDKIDATYVEKAIKILEENPKVGIVYCRAKLFGSKNKIWKLPDFSKEEILYANSIFCSAMFRKSDFQKAGGYKTCMSLGCEDWDLWLTFIEMGFEAYRIDETLFFYRQVRHRTITDCARENYDEICTQMIKNHLQLYLQNKQFYKKIFHPSLQGKVNKYKILLVVFLSIFLIQFLILAGIYSKIIKIN